MENQQRQKLLAPPRESSGDMIETFKVMNGHYDQEVALKFERNN